MLKNLFNKFRLSEIKLAHISLTLVGLMWVLPFLHYRHENPLTSFDQEWWSAMLGVLALFLLLAREYWQQPEIPRIVQLPATLIVIALLQAAMGKVAYLDQALLYVLYLLFAVLLMMLGARLRACFGVEKLAIVLAFFLLAGAELSALIGVLQHFQWHTPLDRVITRKMMSGVYGNLAQPNHYANYIALGLISLGLLFHQRKLKTIYVILLAVPLLFAMTMSGSRSSWIYLLMMASLAGWFAWRDAVMRPLLRYCVVLIVGFGLMHLIVQMSFISWGDSPFTTNTMQRLLAEGSGDTKGSVRLYLWGEAWEIFTQAPWLGVGFGQFAWHHFQLLPMLKPNNISDYYNNAHNLIFQLAAETGIAGLLALFGSLGFWFYGVQQKYAIFGGKTFVPAPANSPENTQPSAKFYAAHWWAYSMLGVLAIHSLLEYPLWYVYFVAIASILLGAFDEMHYRLELQRVGRFTLMMILLMSLLTLLQLRSSYQQLKDTMLLRATADNIAEAYPIIREGLLAVHGGSLLSPYAEFYIFMDTEVSSDKIKQKLAMGTNVMRFAPIAPVVYRQAFLLAQDGQLAQAEKLMEQAIWSYPDNVGEHQFLVSLSEKDPAHFSALLEFAAQKEQEHSRAVHQ